MGVVARAGPLGSSIKIEITHQESGICDPDCTVEKFCAFSLQYEIEFGPHGIAWERTDGVRTPVGTTYANQGVKRIAPGAGFEVDEPLGEVDAACGLQWLYFFKIWFDQSVPQGPPGAPNLWLVGPVAFTCSACD